MTDILKNIFSGYIDDFLKIIFDPIWTNIWFWRGASLLLSSFILLLVIYRTQLSVLILQLKNVKKDQFEYEKFKYLIPESFFENVERRKQEIPMLEYNNFLRIVEISVNIEFFDRKTNRDFKLFVEKIKDFTQLVHTVKHKNSSKFYNEFDAIYIDDKSLELGKFNTEIFSLDRIYKKLKISLSKRLISH